MPNASAAAVATTSKNVRLAGHSETKLFQSVADAEVRLYGVGAGPHPKANNAGPMPLTAPTYGSMVMGVLHPTTASAHARTPSSSSTSVE